MILLKRVCLLFVIMFSAKIYSQNDTAFIKKDIHQKIYIEKNKNSNYYKEINNFQDFEAIDSKEKINQLGIANKWIRVYKYEGQYVLYAPCDWINDTKIVIDDNKIQFKNAETIDYKIKSLRKKDGKVFIKYKDTFLKKNVLIKIIPVDKEKGIYQFTEDGCKGYQYIMADANKYQNFDILVNECIDSKFQEYKFEK